jgi:hypothetical protein
MGGTAFGLEIGVDYWLAGPISKEQKPERPQSQVVRLLEVTKFDHDLDTVPEPDAENDVIALFDDGSVYVDRITRLNLWRSFREVQFPNMNERELVETIANEQWSDGYTVIRSVPVDFVAF